MTPAAPKDKDLTQLTSVLWAHLKPKPLTIAERYKFHKRAQQEEETVAEFVLALKGLAKHCDFGDFLNDALRDRLVCGLNKESIQRRLLAEADLTFQKACEIAQAMEMVEKDASALNSEATKGVNAIQSSQKAQAGETTPKGNFEKYKRQQAEQTCHRCGGAHAPMICRFKSAKCRRCGKVGHIARKCLTKQSFQGEVEETDETYGLYGIQAVSKSRASGYMITVSVEGHNVEMLLDTGAVVSIVPEKIYREHLSHLPVRQARDLRSYSGDNLNLLGEVMVRVVYKGQECELPLVIIKGEKPALFGRNRLEKIKLHWGEIFSIDKSNPVDRLVKAYPKLFEGGHGRINNFKATITLQPDAKPVYRKARPVPYALRQQVEAELDGLEHQGIIKKVEQSRWLLP